MGPRRTSIMQKYVWKYIEEDHINHDLERKCGEMAPTAYKGMDISWPYQKRNLGNNS